jgi:hypothetical protein
LREPSFEAAVRGHPFLFAFKCGLVIAAIMASTGNNAVDRIFLDLKSK